MRDISPHRDRFERLKSYRGTSQQRGLEFERLVADLFRRAHFRVERSPLAARPRQTDLLAMTATETFLVECKWRKRRAGSDDVDGVRSRLSRIPGPATGVLISVSGFTKGAVEEAERLRSAPVLLLGEEELDELTDRWGDLRQSLRLKRDVLMIDGRAHLAAGVAGSPSPPRALHPPRPSRAKLVENDGIVPWVTAPGGFGYFSFSCDLAREWSSDDTAVHLDVPLDSVRRQEDLIWALSELEALGWVTDGGHWCLQQAATNWHGIGASSLVEALRTRDARYDGAGQLHHTEEFTYYDECDGGFFTITGDLDSRNGDVSHVEMSLQLAGVPFDRGPLDEVLRTFEVSSRLYFRSRVAASDLEGASRLPRKVVTPVALILSEDSSDPDDRWWVRGIVAANPFVNAGPTEDGVDGLPWVLRESQLIICDVRDWHPLSDFHTYTLERCQWTYSSTATVVRLVANWPDSELPEQVKAGFSRAVQSDTTDG